MPLAIQISGTRLFALLGAAASFTAAADVTVQERGVLAMPNLNVHATSTQKIAGEKQRTESQLHCEGVVSSPCSENQQIDIVRLDRGVVWSLDSKNKRYTETAFVSAEQRQATAEAARATATKLKSCPASQAAAVDVSKCELTEPKASMEMTNEIATIAGHEAKRTNLKLVQTCKAADPSQGCEVSYALEVWLAPADIAGLAERDTFQRRYYGVLGVGADLGRSARLSPYLAPYRGAINQLVASSEQLKGLALKSTFRLAFSGQPCGRSPPMPSNGGHSAAIAGAGDAATQATSSSAQHAANWGTADALERSTGSGVAGYVAGSAAGAFTGSLVSGLFAKKTKLQQPAKSMASSSPNMPAVTLLEFTLETVALSAEPVPADQFDPPPQFSRLLPSAGSETKLSSCLSSAHSGALR
jgi:hypothetical protein